MKDESHIIDPGVARERRVLSANGKPRYFSQYRYLRCPNTPRMPQLAFLVNVDHDKNEITFAVTVCSAKDKFAFATARSLLHSFMYADDSSRRYTIPYNRHKTLLQNIIEYMYHTYIALRKYEKCYGRKEMVDALQKKYDLYRLTITAALDVSYLNLVTYILAHHPVASHVKHRILKQPVPGVVYLPTQRNLLSFVEFIKRRRAFIESQT